MNRNRQHCILLFGMMVILLGFSVSCSPIISTPSDALTPAPNTTISPTSSKATSIIAGAIATPLAPIISFNARQAAEVALPRLISIILILAGSWVVSTLAHRFVLRLLSNVNSQVRVFVSRLVYSVIWIGAALWVLSIFQVQVATLTAIIGTLGLALSLASQDLAKNFIAGLYLLIERPFKVGDVITYTTFVGKVEFIDLRTTIINTDDGQQVFIPNSLLLSQVVTRKLTTTVINQGNPEEQKDPGERVLSPKKTKKRLLRKK